MAVYHYTIHVVSSGGHEHRHELARDEELEPGDLVSLRGEHWLVERVEPGADADPADAFVAPARYRLLLRHPDGREERGAVRPYRAGAAVAGEGFTTVIAGETVSWQVVERRLARAASGPLVEYVAERDYAEREPERWESQDVPPAAPPARAGPGPGLEDTMSEMVALDEGEEPDWEGAERFLDALVLEEVGDELLRNAGVDTDEPRETWLETVRSRLRSDLERFRRDIEDEHDQIEVWETDGERIFVSTGSWDDEGDPDKGHGWLSRLVDGGVLAAAGFERVRRASL